MSKNCLNRKLFFRLTKWVEENHADLAEAQTTYVQAARLASQALGMLVSDGQIREAAKVCDKLWKPSTPRRAADPATDNLAAAVATLAENMRTLARGIVALAERCGETVDEPVRWIAGIETDQLNTKPAAAGE